MAESNAAERRQVKLSQIRDELNLMWAAQAHDGEAVLRAATHNLVVFLCDDGDAGRTTDYLIELTSARPGRAILVEMQPGREARLDAWVSIYCRPSGNRQVCGEFITLVVQGGLRDAVDTSIMSLLAPDLPVYLWWIGELDQDRLLFERLARSTSRVIVDSATFPDSASGVNTLVSLSSELHLSDLTWSRLTPWRRLLARLWDDPRLADSLRQIRALHIQYASNGSMRWERALLLAGWLANRLGWDLRRANNPSSGNYHSQWRDMERECTVSITPKEDDKLPAGEIHRISIEAGRKDAYTELRLTSLSGAGCIDTQASTAGIVSSHTMSSYQAVSTSMALAEELEYGFDPQFQRALAQAAAIVRASDASIRKPEP